MSSQPTNPTLQAIADGLQAIAAAIEAHTDQIRVQAEQDRRTPRIIRGL